MLGRLWDLRERARRLVRRLRDLRQRVSRGRFSGSFFSQSLGYDNRILSIVDFVTVVLVV
jgi:hypothetical protein